MDRHNWTECRCHKKLKLNVMKTLVSFISIISFFFSFCFFVPYSAALIFWCSVRCSSIKEARHSHRTHNGKANCWKLSLHTQPLMILEIVFSLPFCPVPLLDCTQCRANSTRCSDIARVMGCCSSWRWLWRWCYVVAVYSTVYRFQPIPFSARISFNFCNRIFSILGMRIR